MILNLTQHVSTPEQREAKVFEPRNKKLICELLTFNSLPSHSAIHSRVKLLMKEIGWERETTSFEQVLIGGAPFLMSPLEYELYANNFQPVYSFTTRVVEETLKDGVLEKISSFRHIGFVFPINNFAIYQIK